MFVNGSGAATGGCPDLGSGVREDAPPIRERAALAHSAVVAAPAGGEQTTVALAAVRIGSAHSRWASAGGDAPAVDAPLAVAAAVGSDAPWRDTF